MVQPFNYNIDTGPSFAENLSYMQSLKGQQIQQQAQQQANQAQNLANQQLQKQLSAVDTFTGSERTYDDYMNLGVALGGESISKLQQAFEGQTDLQNQNIVTEGGRLLSALRYNPQYAVDILNQRITAADETGDKSSGAYFKSLRNMMVNEDGTLGSQDQILAAEMMLGQTLTAVPGSKEMFENLNIRQDIIKKEQMTPQEVREATAKANKAVVDAKWADTTAAANLANMGLDLSDQIKDPEIRKQIEGLAKLKGEEAKALSELQRQKLSLEIQQAEQKAIDLAAEKKNEISMAQIQAERAEILINEIMDIGKRSDYLGATDVFGTATGTMQSGLFTYDQDVADLEEAVKTLKSQVFLSEVPKMAGMGTLTDAEGARLEDGIRSLSFRQSRDQFVDNLKMIQDLLKKNAEQAKKKFGRNVPVPGTVSDVNPQARTVTIGGITFTVEKEAE